MDVSVLKIDLIRTITEIDDLKLLEELRRLLYDSKRLSTYPQEVEDALDRSIQQVNEDDVIPHIEAVKSLKRWS